MPRGSLQLGELLAAHQVSDTGPGPTCHIIASLPVVLARRRCPPSCGRRGLRLGVGADVWAPASFPPSPLERAPLLGPQVSSLNKASLIVTRWWTGRETGACLASHARPPLLRHIAGPLAPWVVLSPPLGSPDCSGGRSAWPHAPVRDTGKGCRRQKLMGAGQSAHLLRVL